MLAVRRTRSAWDSIMTQAVEDPITCCLDSCISRNPCARSRAGCDGRKYPARTRRSQLYMSCRLNWPGSTPYWRQPPTPSATPNTLTLLLEEEEEPEEEFLAAGLGVGSASALDESESPEEVFGLQSSTCLATK